MMFSSRICPEFGSFFVVCFFLNIISLTFFSKNNADFKSRLLQNFFN